MTPALFSLVFVLALVVSIGTRVWLAVRQLRHVVLHRHEVPAHFAGKVSLAAHQKAADYTVARVKLGFADLVLDTGVLLALTFGGGIAAGYAMSRSLPFNAIWQDVALIIGVMIVTSILSLPLSWYRSFVIEERFGFNRMTIRLWLVDLIKGAAVGAVLGIPLLALVLFLMQRAGAYWWLYAWLAWVGFQVLMLALYPSFIAPLFNTFKPLADDGVKTRVEALLERCHFTAKGLFVMDGSRRSSHGNAYFTGFGAAKRIVFFDTLLSRLHPDEIVAVLAHEVGHFKMRHVLKRLLWYGIGSLALLAALAWLMNQAWFFAGLGVPVQPGGQQEGVALLLFFMVLPVFLFLLAPLGSLYSRRHEFEADAFAAKAASASALVAALVKLYEDNASTLTPDPVYSAFYDSHPPAAARIARLEHA